MTIPFICVFIAFLLIMAPKIPMSMAMAKEGGGYDNRDPREQQARLTGWGRRAGAAHTNAMEAFAPFAAAVVICHLAHGDARWASILSITFIAARLIYPVLYIADLSTLRSTVWSVGYGATIGLFILPWLS